MQATHCIEMIVIYRAPVHVWTNRSVAGFWLSGCLGDPAARVMVVYV